MSDDGQAEGTEPHEEDLVELTEDLAERTLERLKRQVTLPDVAVDPRQVAATLKKVQSRVIWLALGLFAAGALTGLMVVTRAGLDDWYMHVGMYIVTFSFFVIYLKAHFARKRLARNFYATLTTGLMLFFAGVLHDLVASREVLEGSHVVSRAALPQLDIAALLLVGSAAAFTLHWLVLRQRRGLGGEVPPTLGGSEAGEGP